MVMEQVPGQVGNGKPYFNKYGSSSRLEEVVIPRKYNSYLLLSRPPCCVVHVRTNLLLLL
jgi:hypothetical protein